MSVQLEVQEKARRDMDMFDTSLIYTFRYFCWNAKNMHFSTIFMPWMSSKMLSSWYWDRHWERGRDALRGWIAGVLNRNFASNQFLMHKYTHSFEVCKVLDQIICIWMHISFNKVLTLSSWDCPKSPKFPSKGPSSCPWRNEEKKIFLGSKKAPRLTKPCNLI